MNIFVLWGEVIRRIQQKLKPNFGGNEKSVDHSVTSQEKISND